MKHVCIATFYLSELNVCFGQFVNLAINVANVH